VVLLSLAAPLTLAAQESFKDVEYVSGKDGHNKKVKGVLTVGTEVITFSDIRGRLVFEIPVAQITEVSNEALVTDASVGSKMLFGGFAGSRKQEFVVITAESDSTAEGIQFKVKQGTSANVVAKVRFAVKQATGKPPKGPADSTE
jgi:hypothetical protein